jgi:uncharacterized RDD family membrane protein YckC
MRRERRFTIKISFPLGPVRGVLADEAERAIDAALAGPLPEVVGRALVERRVPERVLGAMVEASARQDGGGLGPELERWLASDEAVQLAGTAAARVMASPAFRGATAAFIASPEIRHALAESVGGFGDEASDVARARMRVADGRIEARVHELLHRRTPAQPGFGGFATRGIALVVDALLAQLTFLVGAASVALILALAGGLRQGALPNSLAAAGWVIVTATYFTAFWSGSGRTPGQRLLRLRVVGGSGMPPSVARSLVRFVGLIIAIIPLGAGFLPALVDSRRRALPDYLSGTTVRYDP